MAGQQRRPTALTDDAAGDGERGRREAAERLRPLLTSTAPDADADGVAARAAIAAWSVVGQSGDRDARRLVDLLGAERALGLVRDRRPLGAVRRALLRAADDAGPVALELADALPAALGRWGDLLDPARTDVACRAAAAVGVSLLTPLDACWPTALDDLDEHVPFALWVRGDPAVVARTSRSIAIVGARAASAHGLEVANGIAAGAARAGLSVVSGGAFGIDGEAHRTALALRGETVAVMAGGVDRLYPAAHQELLHRVVRSGAVVSELACGEPPTRWRFLNRNRLIAALASATVVVEAGKRSGAVNTAGHAAELGRPLGAVPGRVTDDGSAGCHELIRDYDAVLVRHDEDAIELAAPGLESPPLFDLHGLGTPRPGAGSAGA